ncbi:MAG: isocitrate/isopropylmalate dehydrogenase family protein [Nitrososphaerota archaeon]|nr:isocitrate/isopropylmalate dehydrogenase family protein [Candidatus Geocrenenecus dongiae]
MGKKAALIKGDGVGPELTLAAMKVLEAVGTEVELIPVEAGYEWWLQHGGPSLIPPETWKILEEADAILKAPCTTPAEPGSPRSVAVSIRQRFDLYANIRPIKTFKGLPSLYGDLDFICVRETTEGLYSGIEHRLAPDIAIAVRKITRRQSEKVARKAFQIAKDKGWTKVIVVTKRNIMKECDGVFVEAVDSVSKEFPGITYEEYYVDNMAQQLVKNPDRFNQNVILGTNLFMDIISEEAAGLLASIGMVYSANMGDFRAMFEPAHGSAPKYKGQDKVNPTAMILSAAWMIEYLGEKDKAQAIFKATEEVIAEGKVVTYDLKGSARTSEMAAAIAEKAARLLKR